MSNYISGVIGGFTGVLLSHPFDTIRVNMQTNKNMLSIPMTTSHIYKSGFSSFYKGIGPPLIGVGLEKMIVFGTYHSFTQMGYNPILSGFLAGLSCTVVVTPIERFKILQQTNQSIYINPKTLYKGWLPTACREVPGFGLYFSFYEYASKHFNPDKSPLKTFTIGSMSGGFAWLFIYPADTIKSKVQVGCKYESIKNNIKTYGISYLYRGFPLGLFRALPLHGGVFLGFELSKKMLNK